MKPVQKITVGVREAKATLTQLLAKVRHGAVVDITHRGQAVAQMIPMPQQQVSVLQRLHALAERGIIASGSRGRARFTKPLRLPSSVSAQTVLQGDRDRFRGYGKP